jgi:hypothetical protein
MTEVELPDRSVSNKLDLAPRLLLRTTSRPPGRNIDLHSPLRQVRDATGITNVGSFKKLQMNDRMSKLRIAAGVSAANWILRGARPAATGIEGSVSSG